VNSDLYWLYAANEVYYRHILRFVPVGYLPLYNVCVNVFIFTLSYSLTVDFIDGEFDDGEKDDKWNKSISTELVSFISWRE